MQRVCRCRTEPTSLALALCCAGRLLLHYRIGQGRVLCHSRCALPTSHTTYAAQPSHDCRRQQYVALSAPALLCFAAPPRCCLPTTYPGPPIPERTLSEVLRGPIYCALTSAVLWSAMFRTGSAAPKLVKEYAAGDSFGELALLHGDPRAASGTPRSVHAADGADECCAVQCCAVLCCALQCCAVQCCAVLCSALQCSAVQCCSVRFAVKAAEPMRLWKMDRETFRYTECLARLWDTTATCHGQR
jgi:hypothetical protein